MDVPDDAHGAKDGGIGISIENLLTIANLAKSKRPKSVKSQKSDLLKTNFAKLISLERIILLLKPKKPLYIDEKLVPRLQFLGIVI